MIDNKSRILDEIQEIDDAAKLLEIFNESNDVGIRYSIVNLIDDDSILYEIFLKEKNSFIKNIALNRISSDILDWEEFNKLDNYQKITYIETHTNEQLFFKIAENDKDFNVRLAAIHKISDRDFLLKMADNHEDYHTRAVLYKKLNNLSILDEITGDNLTKSRMNLIEDLDNEKFLKDIAMNDPEKEVKLQALNKLNAPTFFFNLLKDTLDDDDLTQYVKALISNQDLEDKPDWNEFNKLDKYEKITYIETHTNEQLFFKIAKNDADFIVRLAAIHKISDRDFLLKMTDSHDDYATKMVIYKKLYKMPILDEIPGENPIKSHMNLIRKMDGEKFLYDVAVNDPEEEMRILASRKLNQLHLYLFILEFTFQNYDLDQLMGSIKDPSYLIDIAIHSSNSKVTETAINHIANPSALFGLYHIGNDDIQEAVMKKLIFGNVFSREKITDRINIGDIISKINADDSDDIVANDNYDVMNLSADEKSIYENFLVDLARNNTNSDIRQNAVENIDDEDILADIARNDNEWNVRMEATKRITDENVLADIARNDKDLYVRQEAAKRITDENVLADIARNDNEENVRMEAAKRITDENVLADIARNDDKRLVRQVAVEKINDENIIIDIARNDTQYNVRMAAAERINDENVLVDIARNDNDWEVRRTAVNRISDENVLVDIARNDTQYNVRKAVVKRIDDEDALIDIARNDKDFYVRQEAAKKINDEDLLAEIEENNSSNHLQIGADKPINDELALKDIVMNDKDYGRRIEAVKMITDKPILADIAKNNSFFVVRQSAVEKITDESILADIALSDEDTGVRMTAVKKISDEDILLDVFKNDPDHINVRPIALKNIEDTSILQKLILENYGYFPINSYSAFKRNHDHLIYESMGCRDYENVLDKFSDETVLTDLLSEKLFSDFRALLVRRITSSDVLMNVALNDSDYRVRQEAVKNQNLSDEKTFLEVIKNDHNDAVRFEALMRVNDDAVLEDIADDLSPVVKLYAYERLKKDFALNKNHIPYEEIDLSSIDAIEDENVLSSIVNNGTTREIRNYAFDKIKDEHILADLAGCNGEFANQALTKITDKTLLLNIALYSNNPSAKRKAIKKIDDEEFLTEAIQSNPYNDISSYIVGRIRKESNLKIIAFNNSNPYNRKEAVNRIRNEETLISLGEIECEDIVCTTILRKTHDKDLVKFIGLSNPSKTVRRYVESITDDEDLLYQFYQKEVEFDNRREIISKMTNEEYILNLLKRENVREVFDADFEITKQDMLIDMVRNSFTDEAKSYAIEHIEDQSILVDLAINSISYEVKESALKNIKDMSILSDFVNSSPFTSNRPKNESIWKDFNYDNQQCWRLCFNVLVQYDFNDTRTIEDFLIENEFDIPIFFHNKLSDKSSIYRVALNCKSSKVRTMFKDKLKYDKRSRNHKDEKRQPLAGLSSLFG